VSATPVQADVTNVPFLFARNPGWHAFFDQDAQMSRRTAPATAKFRCPGIP
jgi:hypothetical protein